MATTTPDLAVGQLWEDSESAPAEWCSVLHVSPTHVLVQRRNGIARYERDQFTEPKPRFRYVTTEED